MIENLGVWLPNTIASDAHRITVEDALEHLFHLKETGQVKRIHILTHSPNRTPYFAYLEQMPSIDACLFFLMPSNTKAEDKADAILKHWLNDAEEKTLCCLDPKAFEAAAWLAGCADYHYQQLIHSEEIDALKPRGIYTLRATDPSDWCAPLQIKRQHNASKIHWVTYTEDTLKEPPPKKQAQSTKKIKHPNNPSTLLDIFLDTHRGAQ